MENFKPHTLLDFLEFVETLQRTIYSLVSGNTHREPLASAFEEWSFEISLSRSELFDRKPVICPAWNSSDRCLFEFAKHCAPYRPSASLSIIADRCGHPCTHVSKKERTQTCGHCAVVWGAVEERAESERRRLARARLSHQRRDA